MSNFLFNTGKYIHDEITGIGGNSTNSNETITCDKANLTVARSLSKLLAQVPLNWEFWDWHKEKQSESQCFLESSKWYFDFKSELRSIFFRRHSRVNWAAVDFWWLLGLAENLSILAASAYIPSHQPQVRHVLYQIQRPWNWSVNIDGAHVWVGIASEEMLSAVWNGYHWYVLFTFTFQFPSSTFSSSWLTMRWNGVRAWFLRLFRRPSPWKVGLSS